MHFGGPSPLVTSRSRRWFIPSVSDAQDHVSYHFSGFGGLMAGYSSCSTITVPNHRGTLGDSQNSCLNLGQTTLWGE